MLLTTVCGEREAKLKVNIQHIDIGKQTIKKETHSEYVNYKASADLDLSVGERGLD